MGSKVAAKVFYDNYERLKYGKQQLYNCTAEFTRNYFWGEAESGAQGNRKNSKNSKNNKNNKNKNKKGNAKDDDDEEDEDDDMQMEEKPCPDVDASDDSRVSFTVYGDRPGEWKAVVLPVFASATT